MYCDRDISCIVIVAYHVLISIQLVSLVVKYSMQLDQSLIGKRTVSNKSGLYWKSFIRPGPVA